MNMESDLTQLKYLLSGLCRDQLLYQSYTGFLGMTNHLSKFVLNVAGRTKALRDLLIKDKEWV